MEETPSDHIDDAVASASSSTPSPPSSTSSSSSSSSCMSSTSSSSAFPSFHASFGALAGAFQAHAVTRDHDLTVRTMRLRAAANKEQAHKNPQRRFPPVQEPQTHQAWHCVKAFADGKCSFRVNGSLHPPSAVQPGELPVIARLKNVGPCGAHLIPREIPNPGKPTPSPRKTRSGSAVRKQGHQTKTQQQQHRQELQRNRRHDVHADHRQRRQQPGNEHFSSSGDGVAGRDVNSARKSASGDDFTDSAVGASGDASMELNDEVDFGVEASESEENEALGDDAVASDDEETAELICVRDSLMKKIKSIAEMYDGEVVAIKQAREETVLLDLELEEIRAKASAKAEEIQSLHDDVAQVMEVLSRATSQFAARN